MMKVTSNLLKYLKDCRNAQRRASIEFKRDVKDACIEMVLRAKESTPPLNGEDRGKNTVTGDLAANWDYSYQINENGAKVTITNNIQYASYVNDGHIMKKHFVPWLYIDGMGSIARHIPQPGEKLFGLAVGTKTQEVKGYHMVEKAKERFFEAYGYCRKDTINRIKNRLGNGGNH